MSVINGLLILGKFLAAIMCVDFGSGRSMIGSGVIVRLRLEVRIEVGCAKERVPLRRRVPETVEFCAAS